MIIQYLFALIPLYIINFGAEQTACFMPEVFHDNEVVVVNGCDGNGRLIPNEIELVAPINHGNRSKVSVPVVNKISFVRKEDALFSSSGQKEGILLLSVGKVSAVNMILVDHKAFNNSIKKTQSVGVPFILRPALNNKTILFKDKRFVGLQVGERKQVEQKHHGNLLLKVYDDDYRTNREVVKLAYITGAQ